MTTDVTYDDVQSCCHNYLEMFHAIACRNENLGTVMPKNDTSSRRGNSIRQNSIERDNWQVIIQL